MDATDATTILGAGKVTGRASNGITVGVMDALTNRESARFLPVGSANDSTLEIEPLANYFIGRLRKDFRGGSTPVGTIAALVNQGLTKPHQVAVLRMTPQAFG